LYSGLKIERRLPTNKWTELLRINPDIKIFGQDTLNLDIFVPHLVWNTSHQNKNELILSSDVETAKLTTKVSVRSFDMIRVDTTINFRRSARLEMATDRIKIKKFPVESSWTPYITPEHECVIGDFAFWSPAVGLQSESSVLAIIPNLKNLTKNRKFPNALNFDSIQNEVSYGICPYRILHNSFFAHYDSDTVDFSRCSLKYSYYIYLRNNIPQKNIKKQLSRTFWRLNSKILTPDISFLQKSETESETSNKLIKKILESKWEYGLFSNYIKSIDLPETKNKIRLADLSKTCLWICQKYKKMELGEEILDFLKKYAENLRKFQRSGGYFPAWINKETGKTLQLCVRSAETAIHVIFFIELNKLIADQLYIKTARRSANFLIRKIIKTERWENSDAFYDIELPSRKRKKFFKDQKPNHSLSMWWVADALLQLHNATASARFLSYGRRALDTLSLYQQLWSPHFSDKNLYGGFGTSNILPVWNCFEQISIAKTFLNYYKICGLTEYFYRGIAAFSAALILKDSKENIVSSCTFVNPCSPSLILNSKNIDKEINSGVKDILNEFGDLYVDVQRNRAFGINGIIIHKFKADLAGLAIYGQDILGIKREIVVKTSSGNSFKTKIKANEKFELQV